MRGTRRDVLSQLENWLNNGEDKPVFWLNGLAGTGKSTIAQTFAEMTFADGILGASFFCSRDYDDRSNLRIILPTLAFQLAYKYPHFRAKLLPVLTANPDVGRESLCSQMEKLIIGPLEKSKIHALIIVDALDECKDEEPASALLAVLACYLHKIPFVKFFITGRPESRIRSGFRLESLQPHTDVLKLHEVKPSSVDSDIRLYYKMNLAEIAKNRSDCILPTEWPSPADLDILCQKAAGLFIFAATVVKFIASRYHQPAQRLATIIALPQSTTEEGRAGIDQLYIKILQQVFIDIQTHDLDVFSQFRSIVGAVVLVFNPLSVSTLSELLGVSDVSTALRSLHSLLNISTSQPDPAPIHVLHKSFPDFLTDSQRCTDKRFLIDPSTCHRDILLSCLRLMKAKLKRNICQLDDLIHISQVRDLSERRRTYIGSTLEYACCFWVGHLREIVSSPDDQGVHKAIDEFFTTSFLYWVEVLSLVRNLNAGVYALNDIEQWYNKVSHLWISTKSTCIYDYPDRGFLPMDQRQQTLSIGAL